MKKQILVSSLFFALLIPSYSAAEGVYRWVDSAGQVHYSDLPPPPDAKMVEERMLRDNRVQGEKMSVAMRKAAETFPITLYTGEPCTGCPAARQYLQERGIPFSEVFLKTNDQIVEAQNKLATKTVSVPTMVVGSKPYVGYNSADWESALDVAGYPPKTASAKTAPDKEKR
jgi:glutaredoxin